MWHYFKRRPVVTRCYCVSDQSNNPSGIVRLCASCISGYWAGESTGLLREGTGCSLVFTTAAEEDEIPQQTSLWIFLAQALCVFVYMPVACLYAFSKLSSGLLPHSKVSGLNKSRLVINKGDLTLHWLCCHLTHLAVTIIDLFIKHRGHATVKMMCEVLNVCLCVNVCVRVYVYAFTFDYLSVFFFFVPSPEKVE